MRDCSLPLKAKGKPQYQLPHSFNNTRARHGSEIHNPVYHTCSSTALWYAIMTTVRQVQHAVKMFGVTISTMGCRFVLAIRQTAWTAAAMRSTECSDNAGRRVYYRAMLCMRGICYGPVSVSACVCRSQVGVLLKRLNTGSQKQHRTIVYAV